MMATKSGTLTAYEQFKNQQQKNKVISNRFISDVGDEESGVIIDTPSDPTASKLPYNPVRSMGYTEWLTKSGMNGMAQKQYDAAVRAAETDYAKTLALYGQNAETLGRAGLTGSGYSDYLTGAGFSAMQGAKVAAADTKALTEAQQRLSYADYLAGVDAQNAQLAAQAEAQQQLDQENRLAKSAEIKGVIDQMVQSGMDDNSIMAYITQHYGDEFAGYVGDWIGSAHLYLDPAMAQQQATEADAQAVKYKEQIYNMLASGQSAEAVRANMQYVMGLTGADTSQLDAWIAEAQAAAQPTVDALNAEKTKAETEAANTRQQEANAAYASLIGGENRYAPSVVERELKNAGYTDDEILAARTNFHDNTFDTGVTNIKMAASVEQLANYSSEALDAAVQAGTISGIQAAQLKQQARAKRAELLAEQFKGFAKMDEENASKAAADWRATIDSLSAEDLPDAQRAELYAMLADAAVSEHIDDREPVSRLLDEIRSLDPDQIGQAAYGGFVEGVSEVIEIDSKRTSFGSSVDEEPRLRITVNCGKRENGSNALETISFGITSYSDDASANKALGTASNKGDIGVYNGKLYVYTTYKGTFGNNNRGSWAPLYLIPRDVGGAENAKIMYDILVKYYSGKS